MPKLEDYLAMIVCILVRKVRKVRKANPDDEFCRKAMDFLVRHDLQGRI